VPVGSILGKQEKRGRPGGARHEPALRKVARTDYDPATEAVGFPFCPQALQPAPILQAEKDGPARRLKADPDIRRSSATERLTSHPPRRETSSYARNHLRSIPQKMQINYNFWCKSSLQQRTTDSGQRTASREPIAKRRQPRAISAATTEIPWPKTLLSL
jgi:hypothetical protein